MLNSSPFIQPLALAIATVTLATGTPAFAQSKTSPIEITDCITITGVTQDTYYVLTTDLTNCPSYFTRFNDWTFSTNLAGYYAAIEVTDNTGRVMIDLNGRTLSGGTGLVRTGVLIRNSPKAAIKGNYHSRKDSGTWGATLSSFTTGISVRGSDGVSLGHSGVANGGIYVNDNERGLAVYQSDRLYMNHMSFSRSAELGAEIVDSDSPIIRAVNFNPLSGTGLALYDSPNATIWGSSGRTHANTYGLALHEGSDDAVITSWKAHRAYLASPMVGGRGVEPAGIYVAADGVEVDSAVFSQTGAVNTCDLYIDAAVTDDPTISSATVYQRSSNDVKICQNDAPVIQSEQSHALVVGPGEFTCIAHFEDPDGDNLTFTYTFWDTQGGSHQSTHPQWQNAGLSVGDMVGCQAIATDPDGLWAEHSIFYTLQQNDGYFSP